MIDPMLSQNCQENTKSRPSLNISFCSLSCTSFFHKKGKSSRLVSGKWLDTRYREWDEEAFDIQMNTVFSRSKQRSIFLSKQSIWWRKVSKIKYPISKQTCFVLLETGLFFVPTFPLHMVFAFFWRVFLNLVFKDWQNLTFFNLLSNKTNLAIKDNILINSNKKLIIKS